MDELSPAARTIGAVNIIYCAHERLVGENTDAPGLAADLAHLVKAPGKALVLGAGGAARAAVYALTSGGWQVTVAARREEQAHQLAQDLGRGNEETRDPLRQPGCGSAAPSGPRQRPDPECHPGRHVPPYRSQSLPPEVPFRLKPPV